MLFLETDGITFIFMNFSLNCVVPIISHYSPLDDAACYKSISSKKLLRSPWINYRSIGIVFIKITNSPNNSTVFKLYAWSPHLLINGNFPLVNNIIFPNIICPPRNDTPSQDSDTHTNRYAPNKNVCNDVFFLSLISALVSTFKLFKLFFASSSLCAFSLSFRRCSFSFGFFIVKEVYTQKPMTTPNPRSNIVKMVLWTINLNSDIWIPFIYFILPQSHFYH